MLATGRAAWRRPWRGAGPAGCDVHRSRASGRGAVARALAGGRSTKKSLLRYVCNAGSSGNSGGTSRLCLGVDGALRRRLSVRAGRAGWIEAKVQREDPSSETVCAALCVGAGEGSCEITFGGGAFAGDEWWALAVLGTRRRAGQAVRRRQAGWAMARSTASGVRGRLKRREGRREWPAGRSEVYVGQQRWMFQGRVSVAPSSSSGPGQARVCGHCGEGRRTVALVHALARCCRFLRHYCARCIRIGGGQK